MRYFFDFEFVPALLTPLSVGIVSEDRREYYAEMWEGFNYWDANSFITTNVKPHLGAIPSKWTFQIKEEILEFVGSDSKHEFWAWYGAYDWVLMTRLIGNENFDNTPPNWPKYHMDLKQLSVQLDRHELPPKIQPEHHALSDAKWNRLVWELLINGQC